MTPAYRELLASLSAGEAPPSWQAIAEICAFARREPRAFALDVLGILPAASPQNANCATCGHSLRVCRTKRRKLFAIQYLECAQCKKPAGKRVVHANTIAAKRVRR